MKVFVTRLIPQAGLDLLEEAGVELTVHQRDEEAGVERSALLDGVRSHDVLLPLLTEPIDRELMEANPDLLGIAQMAVGFNNIDIAVATELGLPVSNTPGVLTEATADFTWAMLMAIARRVPESHNYMVADRYKIWGPNLLLGADVGTGPDGERKVLGIVGYGRIGEAVARRATGFDMQILAHDPFAREMIEQDDKVAWAELDDLLERSDFVTLHPPLTPETRHLIDAAALECMKDTAYLINAARGPIIDEAALVEALRSGQIAGAALDVFEDEPAMAPGLAELPNAALFPHVASATYATRSRMATMAAENALAHLERRPAPNVVNPEVYETEAYRRRVGRPATASEADLRRDAAAILDAGVRAVEPESLVRRALDAAAFERGGGVYIVSIGKAAAAMARGAVAVLGERFTRGIAVAPPSLVEQVPDGFEAFGGGHPEPNADGVRGAQAIHRLASSLGAGDDLLVLISGGGSALSTLPPEGVTLEDLQATTRLLLRAGATIQELNAVRKHLDELKGGRLARLAAPATVRALALSDVVGDPLDVIASGPVSPDPTTFADVERIARSHGIWDELPPGVRRHLEHGLAGEVEESPSAGHPCFETAAVEVVGNNRRAALAALDEAEKRGYRPLLLSSELTGEAREAGAFLASIAREIRRSGHPLPAPACVIAAGETTVNVRGDGLGGRNQELALAAALGLGGDLGGGGSLLVAGFGTDGIDGPTDAAGALALGSTLDRAVAEGLSAEDYLERNDAYHFFKALDDLIVTGPTGTNVMDLSLILVGGDDR